MPRVLAGIVPKESPAATAAAPLTSLRPMPRPPSGTPTRRSGATAGGAANPGQATLWRLENGQPVALAVKKGLSDGRFTEVSAEGLQAGAAIITSQRGSTP